MNNVDIATQKLRELQQLFFNPKKSPQDFFDFTQKELMPLMDNASREIKTNYEEVSKKLTDHFNTGRPQ